MNSQRRSLARRFYAYQRDRFPVAFLLLSLLPVVLSTSAVVAAEAPSPLRAAAVLAAGLAYLAHIRVVDERRDFEHDSAYHPDRPVQQGSVTVAELSTASRAAIVVLLAVAAAGGVLTLGLAAGMLLYTSVAGNDFFLGAKARRHFLTYNLANILQMLLLQAFIYAALWRGDPDPEILLAHLGLIASGTLAIELLRKVHAPGRGGGGRDTYTWRLGFGGSLAAYLALQLAQVGAFSWALAAHGSLGRAATVAAVAVAVLSCVQVGAFYRIRTQKLVPALQLHAVLAYALLNLVIFQSLT